MRGEAGVVFVGEGSGLRLRRSACLGAILFFALFACLGISVSKAAAAPALGVVADWYDYDAGQGPAYTEPNWAAMQRSGATVVHMQFAYYTMLKEGWSASYDHYVEEAAKHGITVDAYFYGRADNSSRFYRTTESAYTDWITNFVMAAVHRYGQSGIFWQNHTNIPYRPIKTWEVWNEEDLNANSPTGERDPVGYGEFLKATSEAIKTAANITQPVNEATVLFGGFFLNGTDDFGIETFIKNVGVTTYYDGFAVHPYSLSATGEAEKLSGMQTAMNVTRTALDNNGEKAKPIWITELGWPVAGVGTEGLSVAPVSEQEQANLLRSSVAWLNSQATRLKLQLITWYFFKDTPEAVSGAPWDNWCGLRRSDGSYRPAWWAFEEMAGAARWPQDPEVTIQADTQYLNAFSQSGGSTSLGLRMASGTSPSVAEFSGGGYVAAIQADTRYLYTYSTATGTTNLGLRMAEGTSPSVAVLSNGGYVVAFQADTGYLYTYSTSGGTTNLGLLMAPGTSPSVTAQPGGGYVVAIQADSHYLYTYSTTGGTTNLGLLMDPATSPSVAAPHEGGYVVALQADSHYLYTYSTITGTANTGLLMAAGTSPSVAALATSGFAAALQADSHYLYTYSPTIAAGNTGLLMAAGTSPSISAAAAGGVVAAFQADTHYLYTYSTASGSANIGLLMAAGSSPSVQQAW